MRVCGGGRRGDVCKRRRRGGIVARNGACVFKTEPMQHEFNMPFQLGWKEAYPETDDPRRADVKKFD